MKRWPAWLALAVIGAAANANAPTLATMQGHKRIVLIAAPGRQDARAAEQREILRQWHRQAADRDIALVELSGTQVTGTADTAASLRKHYGLSPARFTVLLIGKDGHVALRSARPVAAQRLQSLIDAMPMRQAGER